MDGNVGCGRQSEATGMGKRLGLGSRKENLRQSSGTVSKTELKWGVLGQGHGDPGSFVEFCQQWLAVLRA